LDSMVTKCKERGLKLNISKTKYNEELLANLRTANLQLQISEVLVEQ